MWNPNTYRDTDYGLEAGETFEPGEERGDDFVPEAGEPYVQTVLGPVRPDELGVTLVREHLQWRPPAESDAGRDRLLTDPRAALLDLETFFTTGGQTIVSATPPGAGRDARALVTLAQHAPVHIIGACGFAGQSYLEHRYGADVVEGLRAELERDLTGGMDGTSAKPGLLVIGVSENVAMPREHAAVDVVAGYQQRFHLPLMIDVEQGEDVPALLRLLAEAGADRSRVIVTGAHVSEEQVRVALESGANILVDQLGDPESGQDAPRAEAIAGLVADGYRAQVLLSHGFRRRSLLTGYAGRPGLAFIIEQFAVMLLEAGLEAPDVRTMLVDNPARVLTIRDTTAATST